MSLRVAVIGGGCSGALVASELMRGATEPVTVSVVESGRALGRGLAYGTPTAVHLLNVPAGAMSARPDDPGHFLRWLRARDASAHEGTFVPRALYGRYLEDALADAVASAPPGSRLDHVQDRALSVSPTRPGGGVVHLAGGPAAYADRVVLAMGNAAPSTLAEYGRGGADPERFVPDPWAPGALDLPKGDRPVLLMGTGLTAVDVVMALRHRGHGGAIHAVSRHGLLPQAHAADPVAAPSDFEWPAQTTTAIGLLRQIRAAARRGGWRPVLDALRPRVQEVWKALPLSERRRFLRHLRPYWDIHRHRMPAEVASTIEGMVACGRLRVTAGRVQAFGHDVDGVRATIAPRGAAARAALVVGHVIDCTGPAALSCGHDPLVGGLLRDGLARLDPLGLGLDAGPDGTVIGADGQASGWLSAVGPLLKGTLWETTSVPEIRGQARAAARALLMGRGSPECAVIRPGV